MRSIFDALIELLKVKSLVTLAMISTLCWLVLNNAVDPSVFMTICGCVVTYYFTREKEKNNIETAEIQNIRVKRADCEHRE